MYAFNEYEGSCGIWVTINTDRKIDEITTALPPDIFKYFIASYIAIASALKIEHFYDKLKTFSLDVKSTSCTRWNFGSICVNHGRIKRVFYLWVYILEPINKSSKSEHWSILMRSS